jgi:hypothetical protein
MPRRFLFLLLPVLAIACSTTEPSRPPVMDNPTQPERVNVCTVSKGTCTDVKSLRTDRPGGQVYFASRTPLADVTVFADGTLVRSAPVSAPLAIRARLSLESKLNVGRLVEATKREDWAHPYFGDGGPFNPDTIAFASDRAACMNPTEPLSLGYYCTLPGHVGELHDELARLRDDAETLWRAANEGTLGLWGELEPRPWPLPPELARSGTHTITEAQWDSLDPKAPVVFALPDGRFVRGGRAKASYGAGDVVYSVVVEELPAVRLPDAMPDLREALLATLGRPVTSDWVGIDADRALFPLFKGKRVVVFPKTETDAERAFDLRALEHLDLTADGTL